jgi:Tfp pilus assembly protein PilF
MKKWLFIALSAVVLAAITITVGPYAYRQWRQRHLIHLAEDFLAKSDTANAILCLRRAIECNPRDVRTCRIFAALAERAGSPNAVWWRHRVAELEPKVLQNRIDWAKSALVLHDYESAKNALLSIDEAGQKSAEYQKAAGSLSWAIKDYSGAEAYYLEALRLEPDNPATSLNLAITRLVVDNGAKASWARTSLQFLRTNPVVRLDALRQLMYDSLRSERPDIAAFYAREVQEDPACRFNDRLEYLNTLQHAQLPQRTSYFACLKGVAVTNSANAYELVSWMMRKGETKEALRWAESLEPTIRTNLPLPLVMADAYAAAGDWQHLDGMLKSQDWQDMEYLRHLLVCLSLRAQGKSLAASVEWRTSLTIASKRIDMLNELVRRTSAWKWGPELEETLWAIVENFPIEKGAFLALYDRLVEAGNTAALHNLLAKLSSFVALPPELKNNFAVVSLLIYPRGQHGHDLAREAYNAEPRNPFVVSTYSYSLYLQGKPDEALKLFGNLKNEQLEEPAVAAYYGVVLAGAGEQLKARHYLERGLQAHLLPEERNLIAKAGVRM